MNKTFLLLVTTSLALSAHDLSCVGANDGGKFKADMIYGHHFPNPEKIAPQRTSLFEPMKVIGDGYNQTLKQIGENYHYEGEALKKGSYVLISTYKPTAWIKKKDGKWEMNKTRKDTKEEVELCSISAMWGKAIIDINDAKSDFVLKPVLEKGLEITPLNTEIKIGEIVKFKVTKDGKPVKRAEVTGSYDGYASNDMSKAFYAKTDLAGEFEFRALKSGLWYLKTSVEMQTKNQDCESYGEYSTLSFIVK